MSTAPLVSLIIVNYNAGDLLRRCLASVRQQTFDSWELIIVDNASQDGSLEPADGFERLRCIRNRVNIGFAAAQNQGMRLARGHYLMPLNFDIEMTPTFLDEMVSAIEQSPEAGTVTGKLLRMLPDGTRLNIFYSAGHIMPPDRFPRHRCAGEPDCGQYEQVSEVFGAPGAAPLYRREMLQEIAFRGQYFDESFFTWAEDYDLDWRARRLGWRCLYAPAAVAYHVGHPEGHGGDRWQMTLEIRNRWLVILANERFRLFGGNLRPMLRYELGLIWYVLRDGYAPAYLAAWRQFAGLSATALAKRRWTTQQARQKGVEPYPSW